MICVGVADEDALQVAQRLPNVRWPSRIGPKVSCHLAPRSLTGVEQKITPIWDLNKVPRYYSTIDQQLMQRGNERDSHHCGTDY